MRVLSLNQCTRCRRSTW